MCKVHAKIQPHMATKHVYTPCCLCTECVQALLDVYTIKREVGRLEHIKVGCVGDLANGRTVRSLCMLLSQYPDVTFFFVSPENVRMRDDIKVGPR